MPFCSIVLALSKFLLGKPCIPALNLSPSCFLDQSKLKEKFSWFCESLKVCVLIMDYLKI